MTEDVWKEVQPKVIAETEFVEIATDFGDPLEVLREGISNAYDAQASLVRILFEVIDDKLVIEIEDNGKGMSRRVLEENFWDLGNSTSRGNAALIGEKGSRNSLGCNFRQGVDLAMDQAAISSSERMAA